MFCLGPVWPNSDISRTQPDPPENCHLTVKKLPKSWHIFQKNCPKFSFFFKKIAIGNFFEKMKIFGYFLKKNVKFLAIFWQSNGNFPKGQLTSVLLTMRYSVGDSSRFSWSAECWSYFPILCKNNPFHSLSQLIVNIVLKSYRNI